ncbi:tetratricopeptide repeat protein [Thauera linaloolentis]|uniref:Sel1 domain-containing protein repeat-containing protein n=1 Tax=Thauera linaloolentis (strain DSM 12138 / JCM 21573 / CCUG 41526 / CIP 105981 / IAM 15112 / NBRC 102519 / 47Lol) TaxID=1123367 RepID=N6YUX4_THAL4|nr:tetratricopeptide repeat protein [Thauera linaloolentis]ENO85923.1 Sel1 domain-containing protein repeat-containing protein [Thauera linaloolentis 47Lol = DSM 12138]MCM8567481.1 sel1 repeat family protein [Thauera linaloolentis]
MGVRANTPCPKCASTRCRESRWSSHKEKVDNPDKHPFRCLSCSHRFIAPFGTARQGLGGRHPLLTVAAAAVITIIVVSGIGLLWPGGSPEEEAAPTAPQANATSPTMEEAARNGDLEAQFRLGRAALLDTSRGKEGAAEAVSWLKRAATGGHAGAMLQLGKLYRSGVGMPQNYEYAEKWIRTAADAGNSEAMVELGRLYRSGLGVKADSVQAYVWFNRAAAAMNMDGVHERDSIALKLSAAELKAAQAESLAADENHADPAPDKIAQD